MTSKDSTKAVVLIATDDNNSGATYVVSNLLPVFWHLPTPSSLEYVKANLEQRDIPWDETKIANSDTSGFGLNLSELARKVDWIYKTLGAS